MSAPAAVLLAVHAAASPSPTPLAPATKVLNDDTVSPGWLGLVVFLVLAVATALLLVSFRRQLRKVPRTFAAPTEPSAGPGPGTGAGAPPVA